MSAEKFISGTCKGEKCTICKKPATKKLGEEIAHDDPNPIRHNLTAYVCDDHFDMIVRPYVKKSNQLQNKDIKHATTPRKRWNGEPIKRTKYPR